jgi:hypothetical protein
VSNLFLFIQELQFLSVFTGKSKGVLKHSQQQHSNHHQKQHVDYKRDSSKSTPPKGNNAYALSLHNRKILAFHPGESPSFQNNAFIKAIARYN